MSWILIVSIPLISALIGWITNFLAVKMIFHPYNEISILGIKIQGLLPKRKSDLAQKIAETVEQELISHDDIRQAIDNPEFHTELTESVMGVMQQVIEQKLLSTPMLSMFLSGDTIKTITNMLREEVEKQVPEFMENMFEKIEQRVDFHEVVRRKINAFDMKKLEDIVYGIAKKELKAIEFFGAVLGLIVGIVQLILILVVS